MYFRDQLALIAVNKDGKVVEFVDQETGTNGCWNIQFRMDLFVWKEELKEDLMRLVNSRKIDSNGGMDRMIWVTESDKVFKIKSLYNQIENTWGQRDDVLNLVWRNATPLKVKFLGWLVWAGRLKTTDFLVRIKVLVLDVSFVKGKLRMLIMLRCCVHLF